MPAGVATDFGEGEMECLAGGLARREFFRRSNAAGKPAG